VVASLLGDKVYGIKEGNSGRLRLTRCRDQVLVPG
jgi:hypothetical protein